MCSNSRDWHCWNSVGFDGQLACRRIVHAITAELCKLDGFDDQFAGIVQAANKDRSGGMADRWRRLVKGEQTLTREQENLTSAIIEYGPRPMFDDRLKAVDAKEKELQQERRYLESLASRELQLPQSVSEMRTLLEREFSNLAIDSPEFGILLQQLVPDFHVYPVRLCDGGQLFPRARIRLDLAGHVADAEQVPELKQVLSRVVTLDLLSPQWE